MRRCAALALTIVAAAACSRPAAIPSDRARLEAGWTGSDTGKISAAATAEWCDSLRVLEIRALRGDSGLALALYPMDSVRPGSYPVLPPIRADTSRPAVALALRWFAETAIEGFRGDSGALVVAAATSQRITGRFEAQVRSVNDADRLTLRGSFRDVPIVRAKPGCLSEPSAEPIDSGVD
jgi:hypothetical protein